MELQGITFVNLIERRILEQYLWISQNSWILETTLVPNWMFGCSLFEAFASTKKILRSFQ